MFTIKAVSSLSNPTLVLYASIKALTVRSAPPLWLLVLVTVSGTMAMHMVLPALPDAARDLATAPGQMQMTISVYVLGLGVGQLFYGPLSDAWGRRRVLVGGLAVYVVGSLLAAWVSSLEGLIMARIVQSLGGCAGVAIGRAIVRDTSSEEDMVRNMGMLGMVMSMNPVFAPIVGAAVTTAFGWRANFLVLASLGTFTMAMVILLLRESGRPSGSFRVAGALRDYCELFRSRTYVCFTVGAGFMTTSQFAFVISAPFILTQRLNQSVQMAGIYTGLVVLGLALGNGLSGALARRVGATSLLKVGTALGLASSGGLLMMAMTHRLSLLAVVSSVLVFTVGLGIATPPAIGKAMAVDPRLFGSAAGLYGCIQMTAGAIVTSMTALGNQPAIAAPAVMLMAMAFVAFCFSAGLTEKAPPRFGH